MCIIIAMIIHNIEIVNFAIPANGPAVGRDVRSVPTGRRLCAGQSPMTNGCDVNPCSSIGFKPPRGYAHPHPLQIDQTVQAAGAGTYRPQLRVEYGTNHCPSQLVFEWLVERFWHNTKPAQLAFAPLLDSSASSGDPLETLEEPENPRSGTGETQDPPSQGTHYGVFPERALANESGQMGDVRLAGA